MAITVKDIQEKVFPTQAANGYDVEQVDDFLDAIAEQLTALIRENLLLKSQTAQLENELTAKEMKRLAKDKMKRAIKEVAYAQGDYAKEMEQDALLKEARAKI